MNLAKLADRFRRFAGDFTELPLYHRLAAGTAADPELLAVLAAAQPGQDLPVLLLAATHALVLDHPDEPVARFYPSVTGRPVPGGPGDDPFPVFRSFCLEHRDELVELVSTRSTQTNEPNRSIAVRALLGAAVADYPEVPVTLVELGASAGLNLLFDRYRMEIGDVVVGDPSSSVRLAARAVGPVRPPVDDRLPALVARFGIDREPVELHGDAAAVRWLEACIWPEQSERLVRFRAAVTLARRDPPTVIAGDMVAALEEALTGVPGESHVVVLHAWALVYVEWRRRMALLDVLGRVAAGGRAVTWASAEAPGVTPDVADPGPSAEPGTTTVLGLRRFRDGVDYGAEVVGRSHPHLAWIEWLDS